MDSRFDDYEFICDFENKIFLFKGDLLQFPAEVHVNAVNTVGVMGGGIALQFKQKYPKMFSMYQSVCNDYFTRGGMIFPWKTDIDYPRYVLNAATKEHWRDDSKYAYIEKCLKNIFDWCQKNNIRSVVMPLLGCANGGLNKYKVLLMIQKWHLFMSLKYKLNFNLDCYICDYQL